MKNGRSRRVSFLAGLALLILGAGLTVDIGLVRPRIAEVKRLAARRLQLRQDIVQMNLRDQQLQRLAEFLHLQEKTDLSRHQTGNDPLAYLAQIIDRVGLTRLDIGAGESGQAGRLRKSAFSVRVMGNYDRLLAFVQALEQGPRFVRIDAFSTEGVTESNSLEGRFNVTIYEPAAAP